MEIIYKTLNEIKPYEKNPRKNDEAVEYAEEMRKISLMRKCFDE